MARAEPLMSLVDNDKLLTGLIRGYKAGNIADTKRKVTNQKTYQLLGTSHYAGADDETLRWAPIHEPHTVPTREGDAEKAACRVKGHVYDFFLSCIALRPVRWSA